MSDEIIWQVLDQQFCAFKLSSTRQQNFCKNEFNVSGVCDRKSCPLANARYATVRNVNGRLYLFMKTAERQHTPKKWWDRIRLSKQYSKALEQIDEHLIYWPDYLINKCKQRLTRLTQVAIAERRLALKENERQYVSKAPKVKKREAARERKALAAAKIEKAIEKELLERLKSGAYGDNPLNVDEKVWKKILHNVENEQGGEQELESEDEEDMEFIEASDDEEEDEEEGEVVPMEDLEKWLESDEESEDASEASASEDDEEDSDSDNDGTEPKKRKSKSDGKPAKKSRKTSGKPKVEIEYEHDTGIRAANVQW